MKGALLYTILPIIGEMNATKTWRLPAGLIVAVALLSPLCATAAEDGRYGEPRPGDEPRNHPRGNHPWNNPYPAAHAQHNTLYSDFTERPKHLDPAISYSSDEFAFIANIYEPPLQYHFLKRPYTLIPLTATRVPTPYFIGADGGRLAADASAQEIAFSVYDIEIRPGIMYQPHPALARDADGRYRYHNLAAADLADIYRLADFPASGSRELTAADYVYQIKRLAHPRIASPIYGLMAGHIDGLAEYAETLKAADKALQQGGGERPGALPWLDLRRYDIAGAYPTGRYSYRIRVKGKYPQFKYWLTLPFFSPMPWEADRFHAQPGMRDKNLTLDWYPIGTGPYMLTENNPNLRMVLSRNPNFHGEKYPTEGMPGDAAAGLLADAGRDLPFIDTVVNSLELESIPRWNKFLQGYYDVSAISSDTFDQAITVSGTGDLALSDEMEAQGIQLATALGASLWYFGFNMRDPVIGHPAGERGRYLRQAIAIAVDFEEFISIFLNGRGLVAQSPLPPGLFGYEAGAAGVNPVTHVWRDGKARRRPLQAAEALMARAGYPRGRDASTGETLKLHYDTVARGPDSKALLNWWRKQFAKLGIELVVRSTDYNRFRDKIGKGRAQMFFWGWNADYPDPENFMFLLYGPNSRVDHSGENTANYANPEFDRLFEQMKNMDDGPPRLRIIRQMIEVARRDSPWLWGFVPKSYALYHEWYFNVKPNAMANNTLKYKRIEPGLRAQKRAQWNRPLVWPVALALVVFALSAAPAVLTWRRRQNERPRPAQEYAA